MSALLGRFGSSRICSKQRIRSGQRQAGGHGAAHEFAAVHASGSQLAGKISGVFAHSLFLFSGLVFS